MKDGSIKMVAMLAWRSVWRNKRRTLITVISIGFGLAIAIFFISLGDGVYNQMIRDGVRIQAGHITIQHKDYLDAPAVDLFVADPTSIRKRMEELPDVEITKLLIQGQGVARSGNGAVGVGIMGIEPAVETKISPLAQKVIKGEFLDESDSKMVCIGAGLAEKLKLDVGKKLVITTNDISGNLVEDLCRVKGIFQTSSMEIDSYVLLMPVSFARELFAMPAGSASQIGVILKKQNALKYILNIAEEDLPPDIVALSWREVMPELASYIQLDKGSNIIFQTILIVIILFTIFNTILMSVIERRREFGILLAVGTPPRLLRFQIFGESAILGLMGVITGVTIGSLVSYYYQVHGLDFTRVLADGVSVSGMLIDPIIHVKLSASVLLWTGTLVFLATLLLSIEPMNRASKVQVVDILR